MKRIIPVLLCLTLVLGMAAAFLGCDTPKHPTTADNNGITIVVTSPAAHALAAPLIQNDREDGGDPGRVVNLVPLYKPGQDMHSFEPAAKDIIELANADVVVCTGAETWLDAALKSSGNQMAEVVYMMAACKTIEAEHDHDHEHEEDHGGSEILNMDEHVWLSVENAIRITHAISEAIQRADEKNSEIWKTREEKVCGELTVLKQAYTEMMDSAIKKTVVVADRHPFGYLFAELGLDCVAAFPGCSSETSASFETRARLIETVQANGLSYIFIIEGSDGKVAEVVSSETGAEVLTLHSLQVVADYESPDYIAIMRSNLENLKKALQ